MIKLVLLIGVTLFVFGQAQEAPAEAATVDKPAENGGDAKNATESGDKKGAVDSNKFSKSAARALSQIVRDSRIVPKDKKMALKVRQIAHLQGKSREERLQQVLDLVKPELTKKADGDDKKLEADLKKAEKKAKKLIRVHDNVFKLIERPELSQATKDAVNELMALLWPKEGDDLEEFQDTNVKTIIKKIKKLDLTELNKLHEEYNQKRKKIDTEEPIPE